MLQNLKKKQEGFTIIEVMIVLVIAAVILLIVFLAVPALQRNSRNTQKKNIAADLLAGASEYSSNNNGATLTNGASTTSTTDAAKIKALVNTNGLVGTVTVRGQNGALSNPIVGDEVFIETKAKCKTDVSPVTTQAGTSDRQIALLYSVEGSGGTLQAACTESGL